MNLTEESERVLVILVVYHGNKCHSSGNSVPLARKLFRLVNIFPSLLYIPAEGRDFLIHPLGRNNIGQTLSAFMLSEKEEKYVAEC